jgi:hypothetical protein
MPRIMIMMVPEVKNLIPLGGVKFCIKSSSFPLKLLIWGVIVKEIESHQTAGSLEAAGFLHAQYLHDKSVYIVQVGYLPLNSELPGNPENRFTQFLEFCILIHYDISFRRTYRI